MRLRYRLYGCAYFSEKPRFENKCLFSDNLLGEEGLTSMRQSHKHQAFNAYFPGKAPPGYPIMLVRNTQTLASLTLNSVTLKLCM